MGWLETAAFTLLIGAQFLAAIFVMTKRHSLYADPKQPVEREAPALPSMQNRKPA